MSAALRTLVRLGLCFGCVEVLGMWRAYTGLSYALMLVGLFLLKQYLLTALPASQGYIEWHRGCTVMLAVHVIGRFILPHAIWQCARVASNDPGRLMLWPDHWRRKYTLLYFEPALLLGCLLFYEVAAPPYVRHFVPLLWAERPPLPSPAWALSHAVTIAQALPFLMVPALWFNNRFDYAATEEGQQEADARELAGARREQAPVFTTVRLPRRARM